MAVRSDSRIGIKEVAQKAGVAISSVSRVIANHPDVSPAMRERVYAAIKALDYEPDILAQSLRRGSTRTVGLLIGDISNPLFSEIALGAELRLHEANYAMIIVNSHGAFADDAAQLRLLRQRRVDGFIVSLTDESHKDTIAQLKSLEQPLVLLDRNVPTLECAVVTSDHTTGMRAAALHLIQLGHKRIGMVAGSKNVLPTYTRAEALLAECKAHKGVRAYVEYGSYSEAHGEAATEKLLARREPPTALIAGGNQILVGVLRTIRRRKIRIPAELSLVTYDRTPLSQFLEPALSTIARDPREIGRAAADLLLESLEKDGAKRRIVLPVNFDPAESCGPLPTAKA